MRIPGSSDRCPSFRIAAVLLLLGLLSPARAGGPLRVDANGQPFRWDMSRPIRYAVDPGPLGTHTHDWAVAAVDQAVQTWESVPSAVVRFQAAGALRSGINGSNVMAFLHGLSSSSPCPVLFDNDGSITQTLLGQGAIEAGFAGPLLELTREDQYVLGYVVLSGPGLAGFGDSRMEKVVVHEFGHLLGLDHSQLNAEQLYDGDPADDALAPVMSYFRGPNGDGSLHRDDQAWISWLYPSADFAGSTGVIRGRVLLPDGVTGLRGINVIARRVDDPKVTAVSAISGYVFGGTGGGARDPARVGEFMIPGLPPGSYTVELQPLQDMPVERVPPAYLPGGPKFWHQPSMTHDAPAAATPVLVNAGQEVSGIDIGVSADDLGAPAAVMAQGTSALPNAQKVTMPVVITGTVPDAPNAGPDATAGPPLDAGSVAGQLQAVFEVLVREPTTVTAVLSVAQRGADLDLYVLRQSGSQYVIEGSSTLVGTPPEVIQMRLAPGHHYVGIHRAADRGTDYTLSLLATPSPAPEQQPDPVWLNYLTLGEITTDSAAVRWETTDAAPSIVYYNLPLQEIGSPQAQQEHAQALTGLSAGQRSRVEVFIPSPDDPAEPAYTYASITAAGRPLLGGKPQLVLAPSAQLLNGNDFAQVIVQIANSGGADAHNVKVTQVALGTGWYFLSQYLTGEPLPATLDFGSIGAGGEGAFIGWIERVRGTAVPSITLHGTYTDDAGVTTRF